MEDNKPIQQLKKFNFFTPQLLNQQIIDPKTHPIRLTQLRATDIIQAKSKIFILQQQKSRVLVFNKNVQAEWFPHNEAIWKISATTLSFNQVVLTYGQDAQQQSKSVYIKLWTFDQNFKHWETLKPRRLILIGKLGEPENIVSCFNLLNDCTVLAVGTKRGSLSIYQSKNLLQNDHKQTNKVFDKKQIKLVKLIKRSNETDIYFTNQQNFFWFQNMNEKKRIMQNEVQIMQVSKSGNIIVTYKGDTKNIYEYKSGKECKNHMIDGQKKIIKQFKNNYLIIVTFQKKNQKNQRSTDKYNVQILDTLNQFIAFNQTYSKVQAVLTNDQNVSLVVCNQKSQRLVLNLLEKDISFKIQSFFKRSFYNQAWRFAKNQNCQQSLLAQISKLHGDLLYSKADFSGAIKQYIMTIGFFQPSYVIRKFLQVSQIDYLIQYLQKIHEKKLAQSQHTALLLNCYVKKQKIQNLSQFLTQSSLESDQFDIQTAIKVCKDLSHFDEAMRLAQQKQKHELYLKILIQNKKDYRHALQYIRTKVPIQQKQKYIIQFGQDFMKFQAKTTINLIKLLIKANSISQIVKGKQRDYILSNEQKSVFDQLNFNASQLNDLTVVTFKKPDQFFRLFLVNNQDLQNFLIFLIRDIPKLPHEQIVFHRLVQFYLQMMKQHPSRKQQYSQKIIQQLNTTNKNPDKNVLISLFKMYDFDQGIVCLCKKLDMRDDLLNFYIARNKDKQIIQLCKQHGNHQVNLWIQALKYFVSPQIRKQHYIPQILTQLSRIPNLSPLPVLNILSKSKNIQYQYIKNFFLQKLKQDKANIQKDKEVVRKNIKKAQQSRNQYKKLKTTYKSFLSHNCSQCLNGMTFPSIYFMCGHSFHENCLSGERQCSKCRFQMRNIVDRKERYAEGGQQQSKLFQTLEQRKESGFEVVAQFLGRGLFQKK